jgi:two-component system chemotaxis sensor kinase CheA
VELIREMHMQRLWSYLMLPREITTFERAYLRRLNKIALIFFYAHVPVFIGVAALAGTSLVQAAVLTPLVLIGPTIAYVTFENPRRLSATYGFTAMVMGGLLVHFGQGPMQIEMHFYFFVLIALLAVFANPMVIITAAITVAAHHFLVWLLLPTSVFNYQASFWTVAVHAAFVVLESVAAVFVARGFFDNVIGLEKIVAARTAALDERTRDMRLVLDNVEQGLFTVNLAGAMTAERSKILESWLGAPPASSSLFEYLAPHDDNFTAQLRLGWDELASGMMPLEVTLYQLPTRLAVGERYLRFSYQPIGGGDVPEMMLVVITDMTAEVARERAELHRRELVAAFERFAKDRNGFTEFYDEAEELVKNLASGRDASVTEVYRRVHTLKGNSALFGIDSISMYCHELETRMLEDGTGLTAAERGELSARWRGFVGRIDALLGSRRERPLEVTGDDIDRVITALRASQPAADIERMISAWRLEPVNSRFQRVAEQARRLAKQLGKDVTVESDDHGLRLEPTRWSPFWAAFVHAVRNAIDHGIETAEQRQAAGKPLPARVDLASRIEDGSLVIEIRDDGRGVDWDRVRERARAANLPHDTRDQLVNALFSDGFSTRDEVTETSGRGVGLAVLRAVAVDSGGGIQILSEPNRGTSVRFQFPIDRLSDAERPRDRPAPSRMTA